MKTFKSIADVDRLRKHPFHDTIKKLVSLIVADCPEYRPEDDGWLVLLEPDDTTRVLDDLDMPYRLSEVPFDVVTKVDGCFLAVWLQNNQFGIDFLIPDEASLPGDVRRYLEDQLHR